MTAAGDRAPDDEPWNPPIWPRYLGVAILLLVVAGCLWLIALGFQALVTDGGSDVFAAVLGGVGLWYVQRELRGAWSRLIEARTRRDPGPP